MNLVKARHNMVASQVRTWDVLDPAVLTAMQDLPREQFVPERYRDLAYADTAIPLSPGQTMLPPKEQGRILQALAIQPTDRVLEICTGLGYLTALLAHFAHEVVTVDINAELSAQAKDNLSKLGIINVRSEVGDASQGWTKNGPFDVIVITGGLPTLPEAYKEILNPGGRIFAILGDKPAMHATLFTHPGDALWQQTILYETVVPMMQQATQPEHFDF